MDNELDADDMNELIVLLQGPFYKEVAGRGFPAGS